MRLNTKAQNCEGGRNVRLWVGGDTTGEVMEGLTA